MIEFDKEELKTTKRNITQNVIKEEQTVNETIEYISEPENIKIWHNSNSSHLFNHPGIRVNIHNVEENECDLIHNNNNSPKERSVRAVSEFSDVSVKKHHNNKNATKLTKDETINKKLQEFMNKTNKPSTTNDIKNLLTEILDETTEPASKKRKRKQTELDYSDDSERAWKCKRSNKRRSYSRRARTSRRYYSSSDESGSSESSSSSYSSSYKSRKYWNDHSRYSVPNLYFDPYNYAAVYNQSEFSSTTAAPGPSASNTADDISSKYHLNRAIIFIFKTIIDQILQNDGNL